ncbi:TPR-like protein [Mycena latifolia]|nr:TPR-like protein [Mycena latifolia]
MSKSIHLQSICIKPLHPLHGDLLKDMQMSAQLIINENIFLQTVPVERHESQNDCKLDFGCHLSTHVPSFTIAILRHSKTAGTRLLGSIKIRTHEILEFGESKSSSRHFLNNVNPDGPQLEFSATFSVSEPAHPSSLKVIEFLDHKITSVKSREIQSDLRGMYDTMKSQMPIDSVELLGMYERILFLPHSDRNTALWLNILGGISAGCYQASRTDDILNLSVSTFQDAVRDDPGTVRYVSDLGIVLLERFERLHHITDIDQEGFKIGQLRKFPTPTLSAASQARRHQPVGVKLKAAVRLTSDGDPEKSSRLITLGCSLLERFEQLGELADINQSVAMFKTMIECAPQEYPHKAVLFNNLAQSLFRRFERLGDLTDIDQSVAMFDAAVGLTPDNNPDKPLKLSGLGASLAFRFERLGKIPDINQALSTFEAAVRITPDGDSAKPRRLSDLGMALLSRFKFKGRKPEDIHDSLSTLETALRLTPDGHPDKPALLNNIGDSSLMRFRWFGELADINQAVSMFEAAARLTPEGHRDKPLRLSNNGHSLRRRFQRLGNLADLNESVLNLKTAIRLMQDDHPKKSSVLNNLGNSILSRFEWLGNLDDINQSVATFEAAVRLTPDDHTDLPSHLSNLGNALLHRSVRLGDLTDIHESVSRTEAAVRCIQDGHPDKAVVLISLGNCLLTRFQRLGDLGDIRQSVSMFKTGVDLTPVDDPSNPSHLASFGICLREYFERHRDLNDIDQSVLNLEAAVARTPDGDPEKYFRLSALGNSLLSRFQWAGSLADITQSVSHFDAAVKLVSDGHPKKAQLLENLSNSLLSRFQRLGDRSDIDQAVSLSEAAVQLTPHGHPEKSGRLNGLGQSLFCRFDSLGAPGDIKECVALFEAAVRVTPDIHPEKPEQLSNLASSLIHCFRRFGNPADIDRSISMLEGIIELSPNDHPGKPSQLSNLGNALIHRYEQRGNVADLNRSVSLYEAAVGLIPDGHVNKSAILGNLGQSLFWRFHRLGDLADINQSVSIFEFAVSLTPDGHPQKPFHLSGLGASLGYRFDRLHNLEDIGQSVLMFGAAVRLTPDGHPAKSLRIGGLGNSLLRRFKQLDDLDDLNESVSNLEVAVSLNPDSQPEKPFQLNTLGSSLRHRFDRLRNLADLNQSVAMLEAAITLTPDGHPDKPSWWNNLGNSLLRRFEHLHDPGDYQAMLIQYTHAASAPVGSAPIRFNAAKMWAKYAHNYQHPSLLRAYTTAIDLLPELAWLGLSISDRHHHILHAGQVVRDAASAAIAAQQYNTAVEWLDQGRSIIWGQILSLRSPVDDLASSHPELAAELITVSTQLETSGIQSCAAEFAEVQASRSLQAVAQEAHALADRREGLLQQIRQLAGFERFLLPKQISELSAAARIGPVVLLNISHHSCDALILMPDKDQVLHVSLPDFTLDEAQVLTESLGSLVRGYARSHRLSGRLEGQLPPDDEFSHILSKLWSQIVQPVLNELRLPPSSNKPSARIWWCPTGPLAFLPIHAAGLYGKTEAFGSKLSDLYISSYTPSLTALIESSRAQKAPVELQILAVSQPSADDQVFLPGTLEEINHIERLARGRIPVLRLEKDMATVASVQDAMRKSRWAHFACHGTQEIYNPTESALLIAGSSRLTLSSIIQLSLPHADLAFLSACQTATGSKALEDESVHLTAGMSLAGYRGVIGTMWSIMDDDAAQVAGDVYAHLFKTSPLDAQKAAEALHFAVLKLRDQSGGRKSFFHWVPFIHVGV